jgi:two-component system, NtrC family, response regulator AtoC
MEAMTSTPNPTLNLSHMFTLPTSGVVLDDVEKSLIVQALERTGRNQSAAARLLGISRYALRYRMAKHSLR